MGKFDGILICTDLDGTLYRNDKSISAENKKAIEYFKSEGGSFTFITGRLPYYSVDAYNAVQPNVPFGCINGGGIYDGAEKRYLWTLSLEREALELVQHVDERMSDVGIQLCCFDKTYFAKDNVITARFRKTTGLPHLTCDYRDFNEQAAKIIFCADEGKSPFEIKKVLEEHKIYDRFDYICSEKSFFEVLPKGASKGLLLEKLAELLKIDIKKTIAIGDYDNDASMLRSAGIGIAVSNASKAALDAADLVTVSNEEHAIARLIYDLENKNIVF